VGQCATYRLDYPSSWFLLAHNGPENDVDIATKNIPAPMFMSLDDVWLHVYGLSTDSVGCAKWASGELIDASIPYSVAGVAGIAYTSTPPQRADAIWGRGAEFWSGGQCVVISFLHYSLATRNANRALEYRIIDTLRFLNG
jgi:hypothetical protein